MPNFVSIAVSVAELAHEEITHSLSHSPSLFDAPGTEAFASENQTKTTNKRTAVQADVNHPQMCIYYVHMTLILNLHREIKKMYTHTKMKFCISRLSKV